MQRVIILGASNVTIGMATIVQQLRQSLGPVDLLAAHGHGRSYGSRSRVLCRALPSIRSCRLWEDLERRTPLEQPPLALITDVGNDILYGAESGKIVEWVGACADRLAAQGARLTFAPLPMGSVRRLGRTRYHLTKACFFPGRGPCWQDMQAAAAQLDDGLCRLAESTGAALVRPRDAWYGFDPIHIRRSARRAAWRELFAAWPVPAMSSTPATVQRVGQLRLLRLRPALRDLCGCRQEATQPVLRLADGTTISFY